MGVELSSRRLHTLTSVLERNSWNKGFVYVDECAWKCRGLGKYAYICVYIWESNVEKYNGLRALRYALWEIKDRLRSQEYYIICDLLLIKELEMNVI